MAIDSAAIEDLKAKHGEVHQLSHAGVEVIVRTPGRAQWKRFRALTADEKRRPDALETLLRDCLLYPSLSDLDAILDRRPGLAETFGGQLVELAGLSGEAEKKDL
jgi:hypothetical protein